jgi:hypothetical protein
MPGMSMLKITCLEPKYMAVKAFHADLPFPYKIEFIKKKIVDKEGPCIQNYRAGISYNKEKLIKHCIEYSYFKATIDEVKAMFTDEEDVIIKEKKPFIIKKTSESDDSDYNSDMDDPLSDDE